MEKQKFSGYQNYRLLEYGDRLVVARVLCRKPVVFEISPCLSPVRVFGMRFGVVYGKKNLIFDGLDAVLREAHKDGKRIFTGLCLPGHVKKFNGQIREICPKVIPAVERLEY